MCPYKCFTRIDRTRSRAIELFDIDEFLPEKDENLEYVFKCFDRKHGGKKLDYSDFRRVIIPREVFDQKRVKIEKKSKHVGHSEFLDGEIERQLMKIIVLECNFQKKMELMKVELERLPFFNFKQLFNYIDLSNYKYIDANQVKMFLKKQGYKDLVQNNRAINSVIRRIQKHPGTEKIINF